jgi:hypothetical protein
MCDSSSISAVYLDDDRTRSLCFNFGYTTLPSAKGWELSIVFSLQGETLSQAYLIKLTLLLFHHFVMGGTVLVSICIRLHVGEWI